MSAAASAAWQRRCTTFGSASTSGASAAGSTASTRCARVARCADQPPGAAPAGRQAYISHAHNQRSVKLGCRCPVLFPQVRLDARCAN